MSEMSTVRIVGRVEERKVIIAMIKVSNDHVHGAKREYEVPLACAGAGSRGDILRRALKAIECIFGREESDVEKNAVRS